MTTERHLLFAVLAFESDLIDLAQLTAEDRGFVEKQLERKLAKHQHDPRVTLNSGVRGDPPRRAIKQIESACGGQQSLSSWPSSGPVLIETIGETLSKAIKKHHEQLRMARSGGRPQREHPTPDSTFSCCRIKEPSRRRS